MRSNQLTANAFFSARRSRLAGKEARKACAWRGMAFAGKPAPTGRRVHHGSVGAGLPAKRPARPAPGGG
ncbi:hypothetical protein FEF10_07245 [Pseudomonas protegens]|uniref:DUF1534 domain-containing protein n=1 Tax=Pseudomonas protegens TaxID=380021 RepID=A0ABY2VPN6_9PSED|nr:hypothetical protein FEF10_07245 [Pseudomonas protegens]